MAILEGFGMKVPRGRCLKPSGVCRDEQLERAWTVRISVDRVDFGHERGKIRGKLEEAGESHAVAIMPVVVHEDGSVMGAVSGDMIPRVPPPSEVLQTAPQREGKHGPAVSACYCPELEASDFHREIIDDGGQWIPPE
ncbi:hypothetical protein [Sphingosinicella sp. BN140058]|uniref:hypothetical protein n=1 Tax=Sphingosinicella sp. BN140058 TaxID=1892855 RepID=UPI00101053A0|nr:hypothetical protein [Sphingosinicella sp. BN140058]QAY80294.1 hypothetical protein ETR14_27000 [Sphingosinicella sp. BN140058]